MYKMETLIKTERSFLREIDFSKNNLTITIACYLLASKLKDSLKVNIYFKNNTQNKKIIFLSNEKTSYNTMGQRFESKPLNYGCDFILKKVNEYFNSNYNGIVVEKYDNGKHYTEPYSDYESSINKNDVLILVHGGNRKLRIRERKTNIIVKDIELKSNRIIQMGGEFQDDYTYEMLADENVYTQITLFIFKEINI